MSNSREECIKLYEKISDAFHNQSGGDYNDTMYCQVLGAIEEMDEAEINDDFDNALPNLTACWKYVKHCKKIDDMQENMPSEIYC
jgi:hypothetical protein